MPLLIILLALPLFAKDLQNPADALWWDVSNDPLLRQIQKAAAHREDGGITTVVCPKAFPGKLKNPLETDPPKKPGTVFHCPAQKEKESLKDALRDLSKPAPGELRPPLNRTAEPAPKNTALPETLETRPLRPVWRNKPNLRPPLKTEKVLERVDHTVAEEVLKLEGRQNLKSRE